MSEILFHYDRVNPTTWAYLSSLLTIALYLKFNRLWSVRNLDLLLLILLAPGLLCVKYGLDHAGLASNAALVEQVGYVWLFCVNAVLLVRMLFDSAMVRRPLLEPNMLVGGLTFLGISLLAFLTANVLTGVPEAADISSVQRAESLTRRQQSTLEQSTLETHGPGFPFLFLLPHISTQRLMGHQDSAVDETDGSREVLIERATTARLMAILCQLLIVTGMVLVAYRHFENVRMGVAAAVLYLVLPYTALWTGSVTHALPAAMLVWAVLAYRRPFWAGALVGLGCGTIYYPYALLPLWISFYWRRGVWRFLIGIGVTLLILASTLALTSSNLAVFWDRVQQMFGLRLLETPGGAWGFWNEYWRYPVMAAYVGLSASFAFWPAQKNLATLLSGSAALMIGVQFWHAHSGGLAPAWYLPLLLLTVFRPNLEDRTAMETVAPWKWPRSAKRRKQSRPAPRERATVAPSKAAS